MKNLTLSLIITISSLILFKPTNTLAQYALHAQFHLTATFQEPVGEGPAITYREKIVKIDNAKLLEVLGAATTNDFTGADLVVDHSGIGFSVVKGTNVLADVSTLLVRDGLPNFTLHGKQSNPSSFDLTRNAIQIYQLNLQQRGNFIAFYAHERARMIWTPTGTNPPIKYFEKAHSDGSGYGTWDQKPVVFAGTIDLSSEPGKGPDAGSGSR